MVDVPLPGDPAKGPTDDAELDRLVERSLRASERNGREPPRAPRRSGWPWAIAAVAGAFALGMAGSPWLERQAAAVLPAPAPAVSPDPQVAALLARLEALETAQGAGRETGGADAATAARLETMAAGTAQLQSADLALANRVDRLEAEVAQLSADGRQALAGAQDLLLLMAARRRFDAGRPFGLVEAPLMERVKPRDPVAAAALAAWSADPVTPAQLLGQLPEAAAIGPPPPTGSWWDQMRARLAGLMAVRQVGADRPADALAAAEAALTRGDVPAAIAALDPIEGPAVEAWQADARRWQAAAAALDLIEEASMAVALARLPAPAGPPAAAERPVAAPAAAR